MIPWVRALRRLLSMEADTNHGLKTTKTTLLEPVDKCFNQNETDPIFCIATSQDLRYKNCYFDADVNMQLMDRLAASAGDQMHGRERADHPQSKRA